jgi:hypothetical protein
MTAKLPPWFGYLIVGAPAVAMPFMMRAGQPAFGIYIVSLVVWTTAFGVVAWFSLDEASREAHKFAWAWGGSMGLVLAILPVFLLAGPPAAFLENVVQEATPPAAPRSQYSPVQFAFILGVVLTGVLQLAGYGVVWLGWWARRKF